MKVEINTWPPTVTVDGEVVYQEEPVDALVSLELTHREAELVRDVVACVSMAGSVEHTAMDSLYEALDMALPTPYYDAEVYTYPKGIELLYKEPGTASTATNFDNNFILTVDRDTAMTLLQLLFRVYPKRDFLDIMNKLFDAEVRAGTGRVGGEIGWEEDIISTEDLEVGEVYRLVAEVDGDRIWEVVE